MQFLPGAEQHLCSCLLASAISGPLSHGHDPTAEFPHRHSSSRSLQKFSLLSSILVYSSFLTQYTSQNITSGNCCFHTPHACLCPVQKIWQICSFYSFMFCVHLKSVAVSNYYGMQKKKKVYCHSRSSYFQLNKYSNLIESILLFFLALLNFQLYSTLYVLLG